MKVLPLTQATIAADVVRKGKGPLRKAGGFFLLFMCVPSQAHDTSHRALPVGRISLYLSYFLEKSGWQGNKVCVPFKRASN